jgi:uncharacterized repeat protein (TIGR04042 family)
MPEVRFRVRLPDNTTQLCYSPSSTIRDALEVGCVYALDDFVVRSIAALELANERVTRKFGCGCGQAMAQIEEIQQWTERFAKHTDANVIIMSFED